MASNTIGKVQDYIGSMRARYNAVVAASGGHNRYWGFVNVDRRGQCDVTALKFKLMKIIN